jgi:hypothetical protein
LKVPIVGIVVGGFVITTKSPSEPDDPEEEELEEEPEDEEEELDPEEEPEEDPVVELEELPLDPEEEPEEDADEPVVDEDDPDEDEPEEPEEELPDELEPVAEIMASQQVVYGAVPGLKIQYHWKVYTEPMVKSVGIVKHPLHKVLSIFSQNLVQFWNPLWSITPFV